MKSVKARAVTVGVETVRVHGADVGPIVEERERKEDVGILKQVLLKVKKATTRM